MSNKQSVFSVKQFQSISELSQEEWKKIFPPILEGYDFLRTVEQTLFHEYTFYYIAIYKEAEIVSLTPFFVTEYALDTTIKGPLKHVTTWIKTFFPKFLSLRILISGYPTSNGHLGVKIDNSGEIIPLFHRTVEELMTKERACIIAFKDFGEEYSSFLDAFRSFGFYKMRSFPSVRLKIQFNSFDEYLASLSKGARKDLRRKLRKTSEVPIEMKVQSSLGIWLDQAYDLYLQTLNKGEIQFEVIPKEFFEKVGSNCSAESKFFLWFQEGKLIAFDFCLAHDGLLIDKYMGLDYQVAYKYHLYFLTFRDIVKWCIANGIKVYEGGALNYDPKKHLDFSFFVQYIYCRHKNPIWNVLLGFLPYILKPENFDPIIKASYHDFRVADKKSKTSFSLYWLILFSVFLQVFAELLFKKAAVSTGIHDIGFSNLLPFLHRLSWNLELWTGFLLYVLNFFVWITVLSKSELSIAFPIASISYVLIPVLSIIFLHEHLCLFQWLGISLIAIGIYFVMESNKKKEAQCL
ncbi:MAG: GNAT family N-acetyltransferase [Candidatus Omnitrophica bacterium]|nr:GNAT family N-acetyltransferase [Candidatus Omnitrophota bacterium]